MYPSIYTKIRSWVHQNKSVVLTVHWHYTIADKDESTFQMIDNSVDKFDFDFVWLIFIVSCIFKCPAHTGLQDTNIQEQRQPDPASHIIYSTTNR